MDLQTCLRHAGDAKLVLLLLPLEVGLCYLISADLQNMK